MTKTVAKKAPQAPSSAKDRIALFRDVMNRSGRQIQAALPRHLDVNRFVRICMTSLQLTPKLLQCNPVSFVAAALQAAQLGLEPDPTLALVHLVPFKDKVQMILGYRGILKLARNSGDIATVEARTVYEGDVWDFLHGLEPRLIHQPVASEEPGRPIKAAYAMVRFRSSDHAVFEVALPQHVALAREFSQTSHRSDSPWKLHEAAMWRKTAIRRLEPVLPLSSEARQAIELDLQAERGEAQVFRAEDALMPTLSETESGLDRLAAQAEGE